MTREFDITGKRYGKLVVASFDHYENGASYWSCRCDCGGQKVVSRKFLQNGHTKSCGCLHGGNYGHGKRERCNLTEKDIHWLKEHFKHTSNHEISERLKISESHLHRLARMYGLTKSPQFMSKAQKRATDKAAESHKRNGTYPPKGYRIPRSEEFGFKEGHKETRRQKEKRIAKCLATRNKTIKEERARISFGLPQRTKMRLNPQNKNVVCLRSNLRKRGYIVERGSMIVYYNENTTRCYAIENRKKGDRNYVAFTFVAI